MNMETDLELQRRESMRLRAEQQKWRWYVIAMLMLSVLAAIADFASGRHSAAASESDAHANAASQVGASKSATDGAEIVLPVAEQRGGGGTTTRGVQQESDLLQSPGKIVLPDNESWHVGVLTTGRIERIYANLGDYVHKGEVLARMHSHDVHEAQAAYAMAVAEKAVCSPLSLWRK